MNKYQEDWVESLEEFSAPLGKANMENNLLGICCKVIGDDTGGTDPLAQGLAIVLQRLLIERMTSSNPFN